MRKLGFDLILLGAPVSGKDTQANLLMNHYDLKPVRSGEFLRKNMNKKTLLGKIIKKTVGNALPAPVAVMKEFIKTEFKKVPKSKNFIFVGTPKLKPEAQLLVKLLKHNKRDFLALYLELPAREVIKRSYHRMRHDDLEKILIQKRIGWHRNQVGKTIKYFQDLNKLKQINANNSVAGVLKEIQKAINDYKKS